MIENTTTQDLYNKKIDIVVQSKYPEVLKEFKEGFKTTTSKFTNLTLHVFDGEEYGARAINKLLNEVSQKTEYFGVFNDDLLFTDGWLEDTLRLLEVHYVVSAGYVETSRTETLLEAVERTKDELGVVLHLYGANAIFRTEVFKRIGCFDERFDWSCDDLDWAWRLKLNGIPSVTSKKITMAHAVGRTRNSSVESVKNWLKLSEINKQKFYDKHGYVAYRELRREYKVNHQYFVNFKQ